MIQEASTSIFRKPLSAGQRASLGMRVLTTRKWIQGLSWDDVDLWIKRAAPSQSLLSAWRSGSITWETFTTRYREEQQSQQTTDIVQGKRGTPKSVPVSPVAYLARIAQHMPVTVLCWERDEHCHRFTLVELVKQAMLEVAK
jgi:uncharacterized protein YeaO (DUF488 family)